MDNSTVNAFDDENEDLEGRHDEQLIWMMLLWALLVVAFLLAPCCWNARQRKLWCRRIRERRWIQADIVDDWYRRAYEERMVRRLQLANEQRQFKTSRTQDDEIREQYMAQQMEKHTLTLSQSDIHESDTITVRSSSKKSPGDQSTEREKSIKGSIQLSDTTTAHSSNADLESTDIEAQKQTRQRSDTSSSDDEVNLLEMNFHYTNEIVYIPLPGQQLQASESVEGGGISTRRQVPNGCAICLSNFLSDEKLTWSSNPECTHIFHHECLLHWFHAVGRKAHTKYAQQHPNMTSTEALDSLCTFPKLCPCCRQCFCLEKEGEGSKAEPPGNQQVMETTETSVIANAEA